MRPSTCAYSPSLLVSKLSFEWLMLAKTGLRGSLISRFFESQKINGYNNMLCCNIITMHVLGQVSFYKIQEAINT